MNTMNTNPKKIIIQRNKKPPVLKNHTQTEEQEFTFRQSNDKRDRRLKQLQNKDDRMKNQIADMRSKINENLSLEFKQTDKQHQRRNKNKSQDIFQNQQIFTSENQEEFPKQYYRYNYKNKSGQTFNNSGLTQSQFLQRCKKYEQQIGSLQNHIEQLENQKYQRQKYLVKMINKNVTPSPNVNQMKNSSSSIAVSSVSMGFNVNQYLSRCEKQREQAKQIQERALELKRKEKLSRQLLKKMRDKNNMLMSQYQKSNVDSIIGKPDTDRSRGVMGMSADISAVSVLQKQECEIEPNIKQKQRSKNVTKSRLYSEDNQRIANQNKEVQKGYPNILVQNESVESNIELRINIEDQLRGQITNLKREISQSQKDLEQQKNLRQNYERHIFEIDSKNAENCEQHIKKITDLEQQLATAKQTIAKLEGLLDQNLALIKQKDMRMESLEKLNKNMKLKVSLVDSLYIGSGSIGSSDEQISDEMQLVKKVLNQIKGSKQEYFKQFLQDSIVKDDNRKNSTSSIGKLKSIEEEERDMKGSGEMIVQPPQFFDSQDSMSVPSEAFSSQNMELKQSVELLSTKLKAIQTKLEQTQNQKQNLSLKDSQLSSRIMSLQLQKLKIEQLRTKYSVQNVELKNLLSQSTRITQSLRLQKQKIKQQSQNNVKMLMKIMEDQKNRQIASKVEQLALRLQQNLKINQEEKNRLHKKLQSYQSQNNTYTLLNQQLQSQVKSNVELNYFLQSTINRQKMEIQKLEESAEKTRDENDKLEERIEILEAEKEQSCENSTRLTEEIQKQNTYIDDLNAEIIKMKLMAKQKEMEKIETEEQVRIIRKESIDKLSNQQSQIQRLEKQLEQNKGFIQQLQIAIKQKQEEAAAKQKESEEAQDQLLHLQIESDVLEKKIKSLQESLRIKNEEQAILQGQLRQKQKTILSLQQEINNKKQGLQQKEQFISDMNNNIIEVEKRQQSIQKQAEQKQKKIKQLQSEGQKTYQQLKFKEKIIKQLEKEIKEYKNLLEQKKNDLPEMQKQLQKLRQIIKQREGGLKQLEMENEEGKQNIELLRANLSDKQKQVELLQSNMVKSKQTILTKQSKIGELSTKIQESSLRLMQVQVQIQQKNTQIEQIRQLLKKAQKKFTDQSLKVQTLQIEVSKLTFQVSNRQKKMAQNTQLFELQKAAMTILNQQFGLYRKSAQQKILSLQSQIIQHKSKFASLKEKNAEADAKLSEYLKSQGSHNIIITTLTSQLQSLRQTIHEQEEEASILKLQKQQLQDNSENVQIQIDLLNNLVKNLNDKITQKQQANTTLKSELERIINNSKVSEQSYQQQLDKAKHQLQAKQIIITEKEVEKGKLILEKSLKISQVESQNEKLRKEIEIMQGDVQKLKNSSTQLDKYIVQVLQLGKIIQQKQEEIKVLAVVKQSQDVKILQYQQLKLNHEQNLERLHFIIKNAEKNETEKQKTIIQLQKQKQKYEQDYIHLQIQMDMINKKYQEMNQQLNNKIEEIAKASSLIQEKDTLLLKQKEQVAAHKQNVNELQKKCDESLALIAILQQSLKNQQSKIFMAEIPKLEETDLDHEFDDKNKNSIEKMDKDISLQKLKQQIDEQCESKIKQYNKDLFNLFKDFAIKLAQNQLINQNKKYLSQIEIFINDLSSNTQARYKRLQKHLQRLNDTTEKEPAASGMHTPQISSSPITLEKNTRSGIESTFKVKPSASIQVNLDESEKNHQQVQLPKDDKLRKSIVLSQDFNEAFSHEDDEDDHNVVSKYKKEDSINQSKSSEKKNPLTSSQASYGFSRSTHSMMSQLQAQEDCKKQMRNIKMKAKQQKRRI